MGAGSKVLLPFFMHAQEFYDSIESSTIIRVEAYYNDHFHSMDFQRNPHAFVRECSAFLININRNNLDIIEDRYHAV